MKWSKAMNAYDVITNRIIAALDQGIIPWRKPWTVARPQNIDGRPYSGINAIILGMSGYSDSRWLTYRRASKMGGHVRKGEKATPIVFWREIEKDADESFWMLRYYSVFNVQQCEGLELADLEIPESDENPISSAENIISAMPHSPSISHDGGDQAYYRPANDSVHLPARSSFHTTGDYYATAYHELAHSTGHASRLNRHEMETGIAAFGTPVYSKEELVAEFGAAFLCHESGVDNTLESSTAYIQGWAKAIGRDKRLVIRAAALGQKAANYITGLGDGR